MSLLVDLQRVTKTYVTNHHHYHVLKDIHFSLKHGEMVAIMGASGSGKSTLMNVIGFLDRCSSGDYFFEGKNVSVLTDVELANIRKQKIGFVFQSFFLLPRLNVLRNVMLPLFYREEEESTATKKALHMLNKVGMAEFAEHKPNQLSGGQQQRVAIARALVGDAEIILADEPTGSLDFATGRQIMELLLRLNQEENRTIVIVTHDKDVAQLCQRVVMIKDGVVT